MRLMSVILSFMMFKRKLNCDECLDKNKEEKTQKFRLGFYIIVLIEVKNIFLSLSELIH